MSRHAVISGAGIAGPALAHHLAATGWRTTVIERFPQRRDEGQNIDIRGAARDVVRQMGIEDAIRSASTGEIGMRFLRKDGTPAASFPVSALPGQLDGPTAEVEILRGELSRILIEHTQNSTDYRFDSQISDLDDHGDHVSVSLEDGTSIDADLVVIAEGLRSRSRRFVTSVDVDDLGMYFAYATLPRQDSDDQWWNWQHAPGHRTVHLRPDNLGTTRAILTFITDVRGLEDLQPSDQIAILRKTFADVGGAAPRIVKEIQNGAPMYFSAVGLVLAPTFSKGRIVLHGDTAFCPGTFGGGGTSNALIGAYVLAGELSRTDDVPSALASYERFMRTNIVDVTPPVSIDVLRRANPRTPAGIRTLHTAARLAASSAGQFAMSRYGRRFVTPATDGLDLPDYSTPTTVGEPGPAPDATPSTR